MTKLPRFLIADNPLGKDPERVFVIHTREPYILAEAFHFHEDEEHLYHELKKSIETGATTQVGSEYIVLGAHWVVHGGKTPDALAGVMRRMADWYHNYITSIDNDDLGRN